MIPKFANPHLLKQAIQIVSRADLDSELNVSRSTADAGDNQHVARLEELLKGSLGDFQLNSQPHTERRHKRRKVEKETENKEGQQEELGEEAIPFRLLSSGAPKLLSLKAKPAPPVRVLEPAYEDDETRASLRAQRACDAAVDVEWIVSESKKPAYSHRNHERKVLHVTLAAPLDPPRLMVVELSRTKTHVQPLFVTKSPTKERPSPHGVALERLPCPVVDVKEELGASPSDLTKKRRRKASQSTVTRPPPSFWRPLQEWRGKSAGYAMGYEGSRPIPTGSNRQWRYRRDRMRSGVLAKW